MSDSQRWLVLVGALLTAALLYVLAPVFTPFLIAALIAYLGDPLVDRLEARGMGRTLAVVVVFVLLFAGLGLTVVLLIPLVERQIAELLERLPVYLAWLQQAALPWVQRTFGVEVEQLNFEALQEAARAHWQQAGGIAGQVIRAISRSGAALLGWLATLLLVPVVTFYLLRDWDRIVAGVRALLPRPVEPTVAQLTREANETLGAFLRGQLLVMLALGVIYSLGLWLLGLDLALLIGMGAGLVSFVPYLGFIVGILAAGVAVMVQSQDWLQLLPVIAVFGVGQAIEGMLLTPLLVGDRIGLHPVAVIFAVLAGGQLFGFMGVLMALPVAAVLAVLLRHAHRRYLESSLYDRASSPRDEQLP